MNQIVGNPVPCKVGRKTCLIGYVSMGEYQVFRDMFKVDSPEAVLTLICYSLVRGGSVTGNIRRKLKQWSRKDPDILVRIVEIICKLSLPKVKTKDGDEDTGNTEQNIKTVYRLLAKNFTWTPEKITAMSPAQIFISLTGGPDGTGVAKQSWAEFGANRGNN